MADESLYNPYSGDPETPFQTLPMDKIIWGAISNYLMDVHVCLPAQIVNVRGNNEVDVQPLLKQFFITEQDAESIPVIQNVPVVVPRGTDYSIQLPIAVNDTGLVIFSERSLDIWKTQGGEVDPDDTRTFDLSDAIFIPGLYPFNAQLDGEPDELTLTNGHAKIRMQKPGKFLVSNDTNELFATLDDLLVALQNALVLTALGPQPFIASTQTALAAVKAQIDSLKGV